MDYGRALRILRAARNLTQNQVSKRISNHESNVSRFESGKRTPSLDVAQELSRVLGCPFDLFLLLAGDEHDHQGMMSLDEISKGNELLAVLRHKVSVPDSSEPMPEVAQ